VWGGRPRPPLLTLLSILIVFLVDRDFAFDFDLDAE
jgi:hypothetical protein